MFLLLLLFCFTQSEVPPWKNQWQATQIIHIPEIDADQSGWFVYDFDNQRIRQDQFTFHGSVPTYSKNMTEFFFGTDWYFIDWVANTCESTTYGIGPVKPDWFLTNSTLQKNVFLYDRFEAMTYVNTSWLYLDWFGIFEYFVAVEKLKPFRLRMPGATSLAGMTLVVDLVNYTETIDESLFDLPQICKNPKPIDVLTFKKKSRGWYGNLAEKLNKSISKSYEWENCVRKACIQHCNVTSQNCCGDMRCEYDLVFQDERCIPRDIVCN